MINYTINLKDKNIKLAYKLAFEGTKYKEHYKALAINKLTNQKKIFLINPNNIYKDIKLIKYNKGWDVYIAANPDKGEIITNNTYADLKEKGISTSLYVTKRVNSKYSYKQYHSYENIFSYRNIVLDLDWHDYSNSEIIMFKSLFYRDFDFIFENIPVPNITMFTGRGIQLWWCLNEESKKLKWLIDLITNSIITKLNNNLKNDEWFYDNAIIDSAASKNSAGLFRMFGTINSKSNLNTEVLIHNPKKYSIDNLKNDLDIQYNSANLNKNTKVKKIKNAYRYNKKYLLTRINKILSFCKSEFDSNNNISENRHIKLHLLYNFMIQADYNVDHATQLLKKYNNELFHNPLNNNELQSIIKTINSHGTYKYKNNTIISKLYMEDDYLPCSSIYNETRLNKLKEKTKKKKDIRNKLIIEEYILHKSFSLAAKKGNVCLNTAKKVIKENNKLVRYLLKKNKHYEERKIFNAFINSKNRINIYNKSAKNQYIINKYININAITSIFFILFNFFFSIFINSS